MNFKRFAKHLFFLGLLAAGSYSCGSNPSATVRVEGTTQKFDYRPGEEVRLEGLPTESSYALTSALKVSRAYAPKVSKSADINKSFKIRTRARAFTPDGKTLFTPEILREAQSSNGRMHAMLQYDGNLTQLEREELENKDIIIGHPVSSKTYLAEILLDADLESLLNTSQQKIRFVGEWRLEDKLDPLWDRAADGGMKGFNVIFHPDVTYEKAMNVLQKVGAEIKNSFISEKVKVFGVIAKEGGNENLAERIAALDEVYTAGQAMPLSSLNLNARKWSGVDFIHENIEGLDGSGVIVLVYDAGFALTTHPDVLGRTLIGDGEEYTYTAGHATHVNCTVVGDGSATVNFLEDICNNSFVYPDYQIICEDFNSAKDRSLFEGLFRGMAPGAVSITSAHGGCDKWCMIENPNQILSKNLKAREQGAVASGASLGPNVRTNFFPCNLYGVYDSVATTLDFLVRGDFGNEPMAVLFSAGNERYMHEESRRCYREEFPVGDEYYTMSGGPAMGKNVCTIGASMLDENGNLVISSYESFGPPSDTNARVKPTVINYGGGEHQGMISCDTFDGYRATYGTSMAQPVTLGALALLTQEYRDAFHTVDDPTPQLLYAVIVNSAEDMAAGDKQYVDFKAGFGQINAKEARQVIAENKFVEGKISETGEVHSYFFDVADKRDLEATLAYMDYPGEFILNDLDISLISPSGLVYHPHILNPADPEAIAVRNSDRYNNIEKITVDLPEEKESGIWELKVKAYDLVVDPQEYAVAFSHGPFKPHEAVVSRGHDQAGSIDGKMGFAVEREECSEAACEWKKFAAFPDGPSITLKSGKAYYFNKDFPGFTTEEIGTYQIKASFKNKDNHVYKNKDGSLAEEYMQFIVREE